MTPTPHGQVPKALRIADEFKLCSEYDSKPSIIDIEKAEAELRRLHAENTALQQGYDAARMEIDGLRDRVQELGAMLRENCNRRIVELESQLEAIGAGGVEPLRRRECMHQIAEPAPAREYPALPDPDASTVGHDHMWNRHSMRAYVDADRAMRAQAAPAAVAVPSKAVAYLDIGSGGYLDIGTDLDDEELLKLPSGRHMLAIVGTFGVDGYMPAAAPTTQEAPQPAPIFGDEDHVLVPRGLLGAACSAIDKKRDGVKTLAELRRYTTGDLSKAAPQAAPAAVAVPVGATHYQPHQKAYYKRLSATEWQLWAESRKEWIPSPGTSDSAQWVTLQAIQAHNPPSQAQEPFGYFRAEPFGWTDCASDDEGAKALYEHPAPQRPVPAAQEDAEDAAFEAVRHRLCGMQRYSFVLDDDGVVRRVEDRTGNWIEFDAAHELFDPVAVDAARSQAKEGA